MPRPVREELTEAQQAAKHLEAMGHSVDLILRLVAEDVHSDEIHATIKRNTDHLALMLGKGIITNSGADLTSFQEAVSDGEAFIAQPV
jgi:hypothetical protein